MKFPQPVSVQEIAKRIGADIIGSKDQLALGINEIHKVNHGDITFSDVEKYFEKSLNSDATIIILNKAVVCPKGKTLLIVDDPFKAYDSIVRTYRPFRPLTVTIAEDAQIGENTHIEPNVIIGNHVVIGDNCYIQAGVIIQDYSIIGDNVTIQSGTVIGSDAFYFKRTKKEFIKWRSGGQVIIQDNVEIGANCTINKGVSGDTIVGKGTKLDCMVHVGHGVVIGRNCLFAAQVGIGGKTIIEDEVVLYGQVGVAQNVVIGQKAIVLAKSGVKKNLEGAKIYFGYPAKEAKTTFRELAALKQLPEFMRAGVNI
jgi:UDP-3-O-[3-hydroxymyristoyl] glucosamine N-acyltransferase